LSVTYSLVGNTRRLIQTAGVILSFLSSFVAFHIFSVFFLANFIGLGSVSWDSKV